jgi:hypothetical protein
MGTVGIGVLVPHPNDDMRPRVTTERCGGRRSELPAKAMREKNGYALIVERLGEIMHGARVEKGEGVLYCNEGEWNEG